MLKETVYPYLLVMIQFSCLVYLLKTGPLLADGTIGMALEIAGVVIGALAVLQMGLGNFNVSPRPKQNGRLITHGLYHYIRHPMYLAQLLALIPLVIENAGYYRVAAYIILMLALVLKIHFEEKHLQLQFPGYSEYMKKSKRLIPFVF